MRIRSLTSLVLLPAAALAVVAGCGDRDAEAGAGEPTPAPAPAPNAQAAPAPAPPAPGGFQTAPDFTLEKLGGGTVKLSSLRGKVVLIDFWATWCRPCIASIPHLNSLYATHHKDGLEILGVSLDRGQGAQTGREVVEAFSRTTRMDYPVLMGSQATAASFGGIQAIPTAFLIDREGRIRNRYVGMQAPAVMEAAVAALLAEIPSGDV
ncbi:MAG: TlpA disulfide reductase family protein [bacterium]